MRLLVACRRRVLPASDGDAVRLTVVHVGASQHVVVVTDVGTGFPVGGGRSNFNTQPPLRPNRSLAMVLASSRAP